MCVAERTDDGTYHASAPEDVGDLPTLLARLRDRAGGEPLLMGFDFPFGLPVAYARRAGIERFQEVLPQLGDGGWSEFYDVAVSAEEISLERPFYPVRPGGTSQRHLIETLGVASMEDLLRACERRNDTRGAASPLFWTLGGNSGIASL